MALSADTHRETGEGGVAVAAQIVNASQLYAGSFAALGHQDHATAANRGRIYPYNDEAGAIPYGLCPENELGNTAETPPAEATVHVGPIVVRHLTVAGITAVTQRGEPVYLTDDGTFTLTAPALGVPWGMVDRFRSSGVADVLFFGLGERLALAQTQTDVRLLAIASGATATGNIAATINMLCHGAFTAFYGQVISPLTGGGASATLNLEIGGTNLTGGVVTWAAADAAGAKLSGTAITADGGEVFRANSAIDVEIVNTGGTGGFLALYGEFRRRFGS